MINWKNTLITANPGTGKTTILAKRVIELLKEGVKGEDIICMTFTEKAANEMRERINETVKESKLNIKTNKITVNTFHSYAYSYLKEINEAKNIAGNNMIRYSILKSFINSNAFTYSLDYIINDIVPKTENAIRYLKSFGILPEDIDMVGTLAELEIVYNNNNITNITLEENNKFLEYFLMAFKNYEADKKVGGYMDFNDVLLEFIKKNKKIKHYKFVLVDELQDVNEIEAEIAINSGEILFLVGDKKQAIFGFQGGSLENFSKMKDIKNLDEDTLDINYRSFQGILDYSKNHFLKHTNDNDYEKELSGLSSNNRGEATVVITTSKDTIKAAISKLIKLIQNDNTNSTYAIITRTNSQINSISKILDVKGIQYSTTTGGYVDNEAKKEMISYIRGILYDDKNSLINALFTPFSGITLKEAFEISERIKSNNDDGIQYAKAIAKVFFDIKDKITINELPDIFTKYILPISVSIGKEYYFSGSSLYKSIIEFFDIVKEPTRNDFFNYLQITEDNYEPINKKSRIILTTVHKAKGLEFDTVIYVPKGMQEKISFIDAIVYSIIKNTKGINVQEELEEENLRVDFVAFTRARKSLYIMSTKKDTEWYNVDGFDSVNDIDSNEEIEPISLKYDEAYFLFINKRYKESKDISSYYEKWLPDVIYSYFDKHSILSFTKIERSSNIFSFLKEDILGISEYRSDAIRIGTNIHEMAKKLYKKKIDEKSIPKKYFPYFYNINKLNDEIIKKYNAKQISVEENIRINLSDIFIGEYDDIEFVAKLDAVYEFIGEDGKKKYFILDYKTDKKNSNASNHRRQLAVYKRIYAIKNNIAENQILIGIGFIGLKGNVNTGKIEWELDNSQPKNIQITTFKKHLDRYVEYMKDPDKFIDKLLSQSIKDSLFNRVKEELLKK